MNDSKLFNLFDLTCYLSAVNYHNWLCERHYENCFGCDDPEFEYDQFYLEF